MMNKLRRGRWSRVAALTTLTTLGGFAFAANDFPGGSYTSGPYTLEFKPDKSFRMLKSGYALVEGEYSVTGGQIQLTDKRGPFACSGPGQATGTYSWNIEKRMLSLHKIEDKCADRSSSFAGPPWKQK